MTCVNGCDLQRSVHKNQSHQQPVLKKPITWPLSVQQAHLIFAKKNELCSIRHLSKHCLAELLRWSYRRTISTLQTCQHVQTHTHTHARACSGGQVDQLHQLGKLEGIMKMSQKPQTGCLRTARNPTFCCCSERL